MAVDDVDEEAGDAEWVLFVFKLFEFIRLFKFNLFKLIAPVEVVILCGWPLFKSLLITGVVIIELFIIFEWLEPVDDRFDCCWFMLLLFGCVIKVACWGWCKNVEAGCFLVLLLFKLLLLLLFKTSVS